MQVMFDDVDPKETKKVSVPLIDTGRVHADEFDPTGLIQKVNSLASHINTESPVGSKSLVSRVTNGSSVSPTLAELNRELPPILEELESLNKEEMPTSLDFPHLAWESIKIGLAQENFIHEKLNRHIDEIQKSHDHIALLLDLNAELSGVKEESKDFSEKAGQILEKLKAAGIELKGENVGEIKRLAGSQESRIRSEIQIKFTTKVQYLMQQIESMNQILQNIIRNDSKLKEKANQLPR